MRDNLVSAVFDNRTDAERAVTELRNAGINDSNISIVAQDDSNNAVTTDGSGEEVAKDVIGTAALAIPGVGPLVAAGAIASAAIPGAALTGAAIGAAAGGITGLLKDHGVSDDDAAYYERSINEGGTFVSVEADGATIDRQTAQDILFNAGGHNSTRARSEATTY